MISEISNQHGNIEQYLTIRGNVNYILNRQWVIKWYRH